MLIFLFTVSLITGVSTTHAGERFHLYGGGVITSSTMHPEQDAQDTHTTFGFGGILQGEITLFSTLVDVRIGGGYERLFHQPFFHETTQYHAPLLYVKGKISLAYGGVGVAFLSQTGTASEPTYSGTGYLFFAGIEMKIIKVSLNFELRRIQATLNPSRGNDSIAQSWTGFAVLLGVHL